MNALATEAVAITESAAISAAIVVFRDNIVVGSKVSFI
jgi:hypothetical protein